MNNITLLLRAIGNELRLKELNVGQRPKTSELVLALQDRAAALRDLRLGYREFFIPKREVI